jgi:hypothetical protein
VNVRHLFSGKNHDYSITDNLLNTLLVFFIDILVFNISVVKESQICYYYWFSGPKKL